MTYANNSQSKYTRRLEIAATQTKSAYADSKNLKPTEVGFVCIAALRQRAGGSIPFTRVGVFLLLGEYLSNYQHFLNLPVL
jgi:hypothetical protein